MEAPIQGQVQVRDQAQGQGQGGHVRRACTNRPAQMAQITDRAMLDGINIVGDEQSLKKRLHGMIIEQFMEVNPNGRFCVLSDTNHYAGITIAQDGGRAYDAVTLGRGNQGAEISRDDGGLIAELMLETGESVMISLAGLGNQDATDFILCFSETMALMDRSEEPMLFGFSDLDQHLPRRRQGGDTRATKLTHFMIGRLSDKNVRVINALRGMREVPIEFDRDVKNTIAMLQVDATQQEQLAKRIGGIHQQRIIDNHDVEDCGIGVQGMDYGTYFNPSDRHLYVPSVLMLGATSSQVGQEPAGGRPLNARTTAFMERLVKARQAREERLRAAAETSQIEAAVKRLRKKDIETRAHAIFSKTVTAPVACNVVSMRPPRALTQKTTNQLATDGSLKRAITAAGLADGTARASIVRGLVEMDTPLTVRPSSMSTDHLVAFANTETVLGISRRTIATAQRTRIKLMGAWAVAHATIEAVGGDMSSEFFAGLTVAKNASPIGRALVQRLAGLTDEERTNHRVANYVIQAWNCYVEGSSPKRLAFVDSDTLTQARIAGRAAA